MPINIKDNYDFSGWATKNNLRCKDGRTIRENAFSDNDGMVVPLVWNHEHGDISKILGHALLENKKDGVFMYGSFNNTEDGKRAKELVKHGDITNVSIFANDLVETSNRDVMHGMIREVSLVSAGANPGARIINVMAHSEDGDTYSLDDEAIIYTDSNINIPTIISHSEENQNEDEKVLQNNLEEKDENIVQHSDDKKEEDSDMDETKKDDSAEQAIKDAVSKYNEMNKEDQEAVNILVGAASVLGSENKKEDNKNMKHNLFDNDQENDSVTLSHSDMQQIIHDGKKYGSMKESFLAHAQEYGIENIDYLFPDAKNINNTPDFISRDMDWVQVVLNGVHRTPFSRIKSMHADITEDEARAKGYIKGNLKKEEVFSLLKRETTPQTIYKKQKLDRDDVMDITDFDVIAWLKAEMRLMLDEEIARAILVGDGRLASDDDKIQQTHVRSIYLDDDLYAVKVVIEVPANADEDTRTNAIIRGVIKAHNKYKGSGNPKFFTTSEYVTDMLLLEDGIGRQKYDTIEKLKTALRVSDIQEVEPMTNLSRVVEGVTRKLVGIVVNLNDYNIGADKGGSASFFEDFDIDYNQQKYLIETRCSGALVKPFSALVIELVETNSQNNGQNNG